jgi:serine/threonine-protein kinase
LLALASSSATWFPGATIGRYQLITPVASGGMAEIWLARQPGLRGFEKVVVIKRRIGALEEDPDQVEMFLSEARLAAGLAHPNVVQIFELGEHEGSFFIVMEFLDGESLWTVWKEGHRHRQPMPAPLVAQVIADAAAGLHYAHTRVGEDGQPAQIIHRDVSPQNIIVTYEGAVKLVDFGIAKVGGGATSSGKLKGKLAYMSPEQARAEALDGRSDVFSLGVVLFELLTSSRLFPRLEDLEVLKRIMAGTGLPDVRERRADLPEALAQIVDRAMAGDRDHRFASAQELQAALNEFVVASGQRSVTAEIASFMKGIFGERIVQRRAIIEAARRGELTPSQVPSRLFPVGGTGGSGGSGSGGGSGSRSGSSNADQGMGSRSSEISIVFEPPRSRRALWLGLGAVLLVAAGVAAWRPAPAPPVTVVAPVAQPRLEVDSRPPGARVQLDGDGRGVTPLELEVSAGKHELVFSLAGFTPEKRQMSVNGGEHLTLVVDLEKLAAPTLPDAGQKPELKAIAQKTGKLTIDTTPWTSVYLGSRKLGDTPVVQYTLPAGRQVLRLVNPEQNLSSTIEVDIAPNEVTVKKLVLQ